MDPSSHENDVPVVEVETAAEYSVEYLSEVTGVSRQTILLYCEHGILCPLESDRATFDDGALYVLRRIEHLRAVGGMNLAGLKLLAALLQEVDELRLELRRRA
jgi:DNA-binding transcriptional MerR regulator